LAPICSATNETPKQNSDATLSLRPRGITLTATVGPLARPATGYAAGAVKRFVENLLPEGRALDLAASTVRVSKSNIFGLITALGAETTGAFRFESPGNEYKTLAKAPPREVGLEELNQRLGEREV
jgi:serine/threonine-protein kinase HipA